MNRRLLAFVSLFLILALLSAFAPSQVHPLAQAQGAPAEPLASQQAMAGDEPLSVLASSLIPAPTHASAVMFVENAGQWDEGARFQVWGATAGTTWLAEDAIWVTIAEASTADVDRLAPFDPRSAEVDPVALSPNAVAIKLSFIDANPHPRLEPFDRLDTVVSYFLGNDPEQWRPNVPVWGGIRYVDLYPSVDLELTSEDGQLVQRLSARPGADLSAVRLRVEGAEAVVDDGDALRLSTTAGDATWPLLRSEDSAPGTTVQPLGTQAFDLSSPFVMSDTPSAASGTLSPDDNPSDLLYSTFLGGSDAEYCGDIALDQSGASYISCETRSTDFPTTPGVFDPSYNGGVDDRGDVFVAKLDAAGSALVYATYLGGSGGDQGFGVALDGSGAAYVTGNTLSSDFPITPGAFDTSYNGGADYYGDAFVVKLNAAGSELSYATFLGGSASEAGHRIAVGASGAAFVAGWTRSADLPTTPGAWDRDFGGITDCFVARLNASGSALDYATLLGAGGDDYCYAVAIDPSEAAYLTGRTSSADFPTTGGAFDTSFNGNYDAFVVKLSAAGSALLYSTYLGASSAEEGFGITIDTSGMAYITGYTESAYFPTTPGAFDTSYNGGFGDTFVVKLNAAGSVLVYATYLGGSDWDASWGIAVDASGAAHIALKTRSSDLPTTSDAFDATANGWNDAFVAKLDTAGSALVYATYLGAQWSDDPDGIALGGSGNVYIVGETASSEFPTTPGAYDPGYNGAFDAFVVKLPMGDGAVYSISGRVADANSQPIAGVDINVRLYETLVDVVTTDGNGYYAASGLIPGGSYSLTPVKTGYLFSPLSILFSPLDSSKTGVDFTGTLLTFSVSGRVADSQGTPIVGVTISATGGYPAVTNTAGDYTIIGLLTGTYTFTPSKLGYTFDPATRTVTVPPDATGQGFVGTAVPPIPGLLPIVFVHGWLGLPGGSCGLPQPNAYFERLDDDLRDSGYHVEYAFLESSRCYTPPLVENVGELRQAIESAKAATGQDKVILIAHSMGGLVSRAYIEGPDYDQDVQALFTLGSPHLGVPLDLLVFFFNGLTLGQVCSNDYQPVACDLSELGMALFNRDHPDRAAGVTYHALSGDAPLFPRKPLATAAYFLLTLADDGAVETFSGIGLSGWVDRWITDEVHGSGSGPRNYFIRDGGQSISYNDCLKPVLLDRTTDTCGTFGDRRSSAELATTPVQRTPFEYGVLFPGQSRTHHVSLERGETLFASRWQTGTLELTLLDPVGHVIDPEYAVDHPDIVTYEADDFMATYHFPDAIGGSWNMVLDAASVPAEGSAFTSFAAFDSLLALTAGTDREWYAPDATAIITAALAASPASAIVTATLSYADGLTDTAELLPLAGEVYGAHLTIPDVPGYVDLRVAATGTTATGAAFERGLAMAFQIAPASADLTDTYTDTPVPRSPGSAFYQALTVTVGVESTITGRLGLSADLIDDQGNQVAHAYSSEEVAPGLLTLELLFNGDDIYGSRRDGPYTLTHLLLTDQTGVTLAVLEADDAYITASYDYRSFSREQVYLPLVLRGFSGVE